MSLRDVQPSARRFAVRAALLLLCVLALAAATSWAIDRFGLRRAPPPSGDRPPTEEELRASHRADERLGRAERAWANASTLTPAEAQADGSGERTRRFEGFGISVESTPADAIVLVEGTELGRTPLTSSVECAPGEDVQLEIRKQGHRPVKRSVRCREDRLVEMVVDLR